MEKTKYKDDLGIIYSVERYMCVKDGCGVGSWFYFLHWQGTHESGIRIGTEALPFSNFDEAQKQLDVWAEKHNLEKILLPPEPITIVPSKKDDYDGTTPLQCEKFKSFWERRIAPLFRIGRQE